MAGFDRHGPGHPDLDADTALAAVQRDRSRRRDPRVTEVEHGAPRHEHAEQAVVAGRAWPRRLDREPVDPGADVAADLDAVLVGSEPSGPRRRVAGAQRVLRARRKPHGDGADGAQRDRACDRQLLDVGAVAHVDRRAARRGGDRGLDRVEARRAAAVVGGRDRCGRHPDARRGGGARARRPGDDQPEDGCRDRASDHRRVHESPIVGTSVRRAG